MANLRQQDFYDLDTIKDRLRTKLGSSEWVSLKETDMGEALLAFGSNVIHQEAMAYYGALDQLFLSTVTQPGYAEAIAKNWSLVPATYSSGYITVTLQFAAAISFDSLDLSMTFGDYEFYNIAPLSFTTSAQTVVLYEGSPQRVANEVYSPPGKLWSFTKSKAAIPRLVGSQVVQRFLILPKDTFLDSIVVQTAESQTSAFLQWTRVSRWFGGLPTDRSYLLEKDYLGRYRLLFGDGTYGSIYPEDGIISLRYLVSSGVDAEITDSGDFTVHNQGTDITTSVTVTSVSDIIAGRSEIDIEDLKLEIQNKQSSYERLVRLTDYEDYLTSRADVLAAIVLSERLVSPPNQELFNVLKFTVKPSTQGGAVSIPDILRYVGQYGMQTVEFRSDPAIIEKFNATARIASLPGYDISSLIATVTSTLNTALSWNNLGFDESLSPELLFTLFMDVEGLDLTRFETVVESVYTDPTTEETSVNRTAGETFNLPFVPKRYKTSLVSASEFVGSVNNQVFDDGNGTIYGDFSGEEKFASLDSSNALVVSSTGLVFFLEKGSTSVRVVDLNQDTGAVCTIDLANAADSLAYDQTNNILYALRADIPSATDVTVESYNLSYNQVDPDHPDFLPKNPNSVLALTDSQNMAAPTSNDASQCFAYFNGYLYVLWERGNGNTHRLLRYAVDASGAITPTQDFTYASGVGYFELDVLTTGVNEYTDMVIVPNQYGTDINVGWFCNDGVATVKSVDISPQVGTDVPAAASNPATFVTYDQNKDVAVGYGDGTIKKFYNLVSTGPEADVKTLLLSGDDIRGGLFFSLDSVSRIYFHEFNYATIRSIDYDATSQSAVDRAGVPSSPGSVDSIRQAATVDYNNQTVLFDENVLACSIVYEPVNGVGYSGPQVAVLNTLLVEEKA